MRLASLTSAVILVVAAGCLPQPRCKDLGDGGAVAGECNPGQACLRGQCVKVTPPTVSGMALEPSTVRLEPLATALLTAVGVPSGARVRFAVVESDGGSVATRGLEANPLTTTYTAPAGPGIFHVTADLEDGGSGHALSTVVVGGGGVAVMAPSVVTTGRSGLRASVPAVSGAVLVWAVDNGTITAGRLEPVVTFTAGIPGTLRLGCTWTGPTGAVLATASATVTVAPVGVEQVAGSPGGPGYVDGPAAVARFRAPTGLLADSDGTVLVADEGHGHDALDVDASLLHAFAYLGQHTDAISNEKEEPPRVVAHADGRQQNFHEVGDGDDPDQLSALQNGQRTDLVLQHHLRGPLDGHVRRGRDDLLRHDIGDVQLLQYVGELVDAQGRGGGRPCFLEVPVRHDSQKVGLAVRYREVGDPVGFHDFPCLEHRSLQGHRMQTRFHTPADVHVFPPCI